MQAGLSEIKQVSEVYGCFLVSNRGAVIEADPPLEFSEEELGSIGSALVQVLLGLETWADPAAELDIHYQRLRLIARDLGRMVLVIVCDPEVDTSMLRLTVNVVTQRWSADPDVQDVLADHPPEREVDLPDLYGEEGEGEEPGSDNQG